jgi:cellulose synthase/poly-beta-1,6-N-acetylglucosamine synthase-like glycosyltransferase
VVSLAQEPAPPSADTFAHTRTVSVIVCAFDDGRQALLEESLRAVLGQSRPPEELVLVVDHNHELERRMREAYPDATVVANDGAQGLSQARNTGVRNSSGDIVVFLDDDACPEHDWLAELLPGYDDPAVMGAGGLVLPRWEAERPAWQPAEFDWVVGCSYRGLPESVAPVRNPIGANMSFRRSVLERTGDFVEGIGRVGKRPLGCEETELSIRARETHRDGVILHVPSARVRHAVPAQRADWGYFVSRCFAEGISKAKVARRRGSDTALASERTYVTRTLPRGVALGLRQALRGDIGGLGRASAIVIGLGLAVAGYARGRLLP